ncbi:37S ribosomal s11 [Trichoderma cornu-damae]|uniref:37S ribosomal s11 n=1 Tax=Trichoderma cornu-damae TaxID=654480 RepID=A0A9P8TYJ3_9HYPO|nr:37S ribosomal s11 [Trichoderma cornu-damae]
MSRPLRTCFAARPLARISQTAVSRTGAQNARALTQTSARLEDANDAETADPPKTVPPKPQTESLLESIYGSSLAVGSRSAQPNPMASLSQNMVFQALNKSNVDTSVLSGAPLQAAQKKDDELEPFHFHVYSHKHNTHITCTKPNREPIISMSCGNIGFRKSRRGTFDSAYSLTKYVLERLIHTGWPIKIQRLELVLQGFGQGREAAIKVLMSPEGKVLRDKIVRVADSTRIKFAGTRSEKPRRL